MLRTILSSGGTWSEKLLYILISVFCVLLSLTLHELGHGLAAYAMGDKTAKYSGRLSLNPLHHLEPLGAICLFLFGFGWAKPVPVNPYNFKNQKSGMVLTSLAGPFTNFIIAFIANVIMTIIGTITFTGRGIGFDIATICYTLCYYMMIMNLGLGIFNLIPVPPLDGSKVLGAVLPTNLYFSYMKYEQFGFIILIILINLPFFNSFLNLCMNGLITLFDSIIGLVL